MEAKLPVQELLERPDDAELLDMQRTKSRPKVVVEEYLNHDDSSEEEGDLEAAIKIEEK